MKRPDISRRCFLSTAGWSAAGLGASGLIAAAVAVEQGVPPRAVDVARVQRLLE